MKTKTDYSTVLKESKQETKEKEKEMKTKFTDKSISLKTLLIVIVSITLGALAGYFVNDLVHTIVNAKASALVTTMQPAAVPEVSKK